MLVAGLDPGTNGCLCFIRPGNEAYPKFYRFDKYDYTQIAAALEEAQPDLTVLETPGMPPGNGKISYAKVAYSKGVLEGILMALHLPYIKVGPGKWQKAMNCLTGGDKNISKAKAIELYPDHKFTHHDSDAFLIATYGLQHGFR